MNLKLKLSLLYFVLSILIIGCATYQEQYHSSVTDWNVENNQIESDIARTFYLIGDAGNAKKDAPLTHFNLLKQELNTASKNSTVLFLGDNIYEKGMPKKSDPNRALAEHRLDVQLDLVKEFNGHPIFIPGNHDYYSNGIKGLEREADYIKDKLDIKDAFLPKNGCPLKKVDITDDLVLLIVDSQWYLENWDDNPTMNDNCEIKTRHQFFAEFESIVKKNVTKTIVIAIHHPMFSNGTHGGQFSLKSQFHPFKNTIPLPGVGTLVNVLRKTSGISPQDMNNSLYLELKKRIVTVSQKSKKIIFASGHEHNLQYIVKDNKPQIVSGSGSKTSPSRTINGGKFSYGGLGYAKLVVYKNGASWVHFYSEIDGEKKLLFKTEIHPPDIIKMDVDYKDNFPAVVNASIYSNEEVTKSKMFKNLWGEHYRKYYGTQISAPTVLLDTLMGGLTPTRKGGGNQSRSLRLEDKNGKEFVMRALRKSATQYLQAVAFKDNYVEGQFDDTYTESLLLDVYTAAHPYAPFTVGNLADAIDIYHTNPTLYYIPKQNALKHYNEDFGDELYMIEERASSGHGDLESFGHSNKLISTDDLLKNMRKSDDYKLDEPTYIRARLFDMLIGDWDRHQDQWRWAEFKNGSKRTYKPVPRDRDQAFSKNDGFIMGFITRVIPALKLMQVYDKDMRSVKWFNLEPYPLDMALINTSNFKNWEEQVKIIQTGITDEIIENAFKQMPQEVNDETIDHIKKSLKGRLKNLPAIAKEYYSHLSKYAVVKGTDKDNWFDITRLNNGKTSVQVYNIKNGQKGTQFFNKTYSKEETSEVWVYGLDDSDVFKVTGDQNDAIPLRIIGGQNNDIYDIENGKKVSIYDYKTKKNTFKTDQGKHHLFNNYESNSYNYKKLKYSQNQLVPLIGSNPDDGLKIGLNDTFTVYGFNRNPYTQQHRLSLGYYFATKGYDLQFSSEFANIFNRWNFILESRITSPNYSINHFGFGNETTNFEEVYDDDYHRVKISAYKTAPSITWKGRMGSAFKLGGSIEGIEVEETMDRFINTIPNIPVERISYLGFHSSYSYENYDNAAFPTLGMHFSLETGWKTNLENSDQNHTYFTPSLGFNYKISSGGSIVLATKLKGNIIIGDEIEFYHAASIGGLDGLRGYRNQRFTGTKSYFQNTDIRFNLRKVKTALVPLQIGLLAGFDYGRVWLDDENSKDWKTSYGAGFWLVGAEMINLNLSLFNSKDGAYIQFGLGFGF